MLKYHDKASMGRVLKPEVALSTREAQRVRDLIMIRSHQRPCGRCCLCPKGCYRPHNVRSIYCTCGLLAFCSLAVLVGIWTGAATWYFYSKEFKPTTCTPSENVTIESDIGARVCSCNSKDSNTSHCRSAIPCIQIWISYELPDGGRVETVLHETLEDIKSNWQCSHLPKTCFRNRRENEVLMADFRRQWGDTTRPYECYHHPTRVHDVIRVPGLPPHTEKLTLHGLLWPAVCSVVFFLGMLAPILVCGCQYVWGSRVPAGIMVEQQDQTIPLDSGETAPPSSASTV